MAFLGDIPQPYVAELCEEGTWIFAYPVWVPEPWKDVDEEDGGRDGAGHGLEVDLLV